MLTPKQVSTELGEAMRNRFAQAGIAVMASAGDKTMNGLPLVVVGPCTWGVLLDRERPDTLASQSAYCLAREVSLASCSRLEPVNLLELRTAVEEVGRSLLLLGDLKPQMGNTRTSHDKAAAALGRFELEVRRSTARVLQLLDAAQALQVVSAPWPSATMLDHSAIGILRKSPIASASPRSVV